MVRAAAVAFTLAGVMGVPLPGATEARAADVSVLYAGSLVKLMKHGIGAAFDASSGDHFVGYAGGSNALADQIKGRLRHADVFISATPKVNDTLMGATNGNWVAWYLTFATSPLVIAYNPSSRFAADLKSKPWYEVLREPGIRIGRTDPTLDPKGRLTLQLLQHAERVYHQPGLAQAVLGARDNPAQVRPEESLTGRMQSGQIDVGFFYSTETTDLKLPSIKPAPEVATKPPPWRRRMAADTSLRRLYAPRRPVEPRWLAGTGLIPRRCRMSPPRDRDGEQRSLHCLDVQS